MLSETVSDSLNFTLIIVSLVLLGTVLLEFLKDKDKHRDLGIKISLFALVFLCFIFFNLAFILEVFGDIKSLAIYSVMIACAIAIFFILIFLYTRQRHKLNKVSLVILMASVLTGTPFYIITRFIGFLSLDLQNAIESVLMILILMSIYSLITMFLIKNREHHKK